MWTSEKENWKTSVKIAPYLRGFLISSWHFVLCWYDRIMNAFLYVFISLILTLFIYGVFPIVFALLRKKSIRSWVYTLLCCVFNFFVFFFKVWIFSDNNPSPFLLWTPIFIWIGRKKLIKKQLLTIRRK